MSSQKQDDEGSGKFLSGIASKISVGNLLSFAALILFPGFFFGLLSNIFVAVIVVPATLFLAFNAYINFVTQEAPCPQCGAIAIGMKNGEPTSCQSCNEPLVADVGSSPPRWLEQTVFQADTNDEGPESRASGGRGPSSSPSSPPVRSEPKDFVDVDVM